MDKRGRLNKDEAYQLAIYLCNVASLGSYVVIEVFWSNPWLNRVLLPCFLQISKVFVHDDSLYSLDSPVISCSQLSYSDPSASRHHEVSTLRPLIGYPRIKWNSWLRDNVGLLSRS